MVDKAAVMEAVQASLTAQIEAMRTSAEETRRAATHEEARAENDKDTRGLEQSYLARGQAMRVEELEEAATRLRFLDLRPFEPDEPIQLGALVTLAVDDDEATYFVAPAAGGTRVTIEGVEVQLVTPAAPLGRALVERHAGDDFVLRIGGREREYEILAVA
ncbi:MAG: GreA/GreB family elongation factor [Myxococcales bacterium]|nr:GreA/GreB family elongation factor [Myxococcales bacterium]